MSTFVSVATIWAPGTLPNYELYVVLMAKAREMVNAGKMVKSTLPHASKPAQAQVYSDVTRPDLGLGDVNELQAYVTSMVIQYNDATQTATGHWPEGEPQKQMRIFVNEAAANEWIEFVLQYGALDAMILSQEEVAAKLDLPSDDIIQQYVTQV
jgi:hypothetical protein